MGNQLQGWIEKVLNSGIREMATFANGLLRDYQSIENAISLLWSNGPVEGNVNKLQTIKRQMYGRARFNLLRKRLVLTPTYPPKVGKNPFRRNIYLTVNWSWMFIGITYRLLHQLGII
ncbi:transposase [Pedobacter sp. GR22-6]|uniref:transposase n=1 Tax=Pedobacter sp. GR22-6 TaxID=3127957 RepID=UPI003FCECE53